MSNLSNYRDSLNQDDKRRFKISKQFQQDSYKYISDNESKKDVKIDLMKQLRDKQQSLR